MMEESKKYSKFLSQLIADKFFLYGNHAKNALTFHGIPEKSLVVSGSARYDTLFNQKKNTEEKYIILMGSALPSTAFSYFLSNKVILEWEKMITSVFRALKEIKDSNEEIIIKRHPTQNKEIIKFQPLADKFLPGVKVYKNKNTYELLSKSKLVVSMLSSVITEAIILDKPVVLPRHIKHDLGPHFTQTNAVLTIEKPEEALTVIKKALYDDDVKAKLKMGREKFIKENLEYGGKSTEKTLELIKEILKK
jgi:UDP-N-acetylglucosamine 2-epimerase